MNSEGTGIRVAISGARGVPAFYGGFETAATEIAPRLVDRGFDVTVYCRPRYSLPSRPTHYRGVRLVYLPSLSHRALESPSAELLASIHSWRQHFDILYVLGFRASIVYWPQRLTKTKVVFNTDGFDWQRSKWGRLGRAYLRCSERLGVMCASGGLVSDSRAVAQYFGERYKRQAVYLSYGAPPPRASPQVTSDDYALQSRSFYLVVARLEPENHVLAIIEQYLRSESRYPLAVVGGLNYETPYAAAIRRLESPRIRLLGSIYQQEHLDALYQSCFAYIHGHAVGGTNPSLLRAMGAGALVLANGVVFNREVLGRTGLYWNPMAGDLTQLIRQVEVAPHLGARLGQLARRRAFARYDWEKIADGYARYFRALHEAATGQALPRRLAAIQQDATLTTASRMFTTGRLSSFAKHVGVSRRPRQTSA